MKRSFVLAENDNFLSLCGWLFSFCCCCCAAASYSSSGWLLGNLGFFLFTQKWYGYFLYFGFSLFLQFWTEPSHRRCHPWNNCSKSLQWDGRYRLTAKVTSRITEHLLYCRAVTNRVRILVRCSSPLLMYRHLNTTPPKGWFKAPIWKCTSKVTSIISKCSNIRVWALCSFNHTHRLQSNSAGSAGSLPLLSPLASIILLRSKSHQFALSPLRSSATTALRSWSDCVGRASSARCAVLLATSRARTKFHLSVHFLLIKLRPSHYF